jgi:hypothetical protein
MLDPDFAFLLGFNKQNQFNVLHSRVILSGLADRLSTLCIWDPGGPTWGGKEDKNTLYQHLDSIREALIYLMTENSEFIDAIELSTSSIQAVTKRCDIWRLAMQDIVGIAKKDPRCFSRELKDKLFKSSQTCAICKGRIEEVDDSAIDHVKQYWSGGRTIPENARLVHRFCNWSRSRTDQAGAPTTT